MSFKVICIDGVKQGYHFTDGSLAKSHEEIYEGEVYTVIGFLGLNNRSYVLSEREYGTGYFKWRFIPLSNIDERELINTNEESIIVNESSFKNN